jgi:hypothetical protein
MYIVLFTIVPFRVMVYAYNIARKYVACIRLLSSSAAYFSFTLISFHFQNPARDSIKGNIKDRQEVLIL